MMRNASCFVNLCHVYNYLHIPKEVKLNQTPYLYTRVSLISASKYHALQLKAHKMVNPKVIAGGVTEHLSDQSLLRT